MSDFLNGTLPDSEKLNTDAKAQKKFLDHLEKILHEAEELLGRALDELGEHHQLYPRNPSDN